MVMVTDPVGAHLGMVVERFVSRLNGRHMPYEPLERNTLRSGNDGRGSHLDAAAHHGPSDPCLAQPCKYLFPGEIPLLVCGRRHQDVGTSSHRRQLSGATMADRHRRVGYLRATGGITLGKQHCQGLADNIASPHHHGVFPGHRNIRPAQELLDTMRRAGQKPGTPLGYPADILGVKRIHILEWVNRVKHPDRGDSIGERQLNKDPVDGVVLVQPGNQFQQLFLAGVVR